MAKKISAKEKREAEKLQKKNKYKAEEDQRKKAQEEEAERLRNEAEKQRRLSRIASIEREDESLAKVKKSRVKAAGLKSTFILGEDRLFMTSFGNGAEAVPEKYVIGGKVSNAAEQSALRVNPDNYEFKVSGRIVESARSTNPLHTENGTDEFYRDDQIHLRSKLEQMYFGHECQDNIHIQLIYQILDIEKILAVQANNIVFTIDNMLRRSESEHDDFIGYMSDTQYATYRKANAQGKYQTFCELLDKPQLAYFGSSLLPLDKNGKKLKKDNPLWEAYEKKCYYILSAMRLVRQVTAHGSEDTRAAMYQLENLTSKSSAYRRELAETLDLLYGERVSSLNNGFMEHAGKDLYILEQLLGVKDAAQKIQLAKDYYAFIILKDYKYIGFSIKKVRENITKYHAEQIAKQDYDSVRPKLNHILDFCIYRYYSDKDNKYYLDRLVEKLRACRKDSEKELIYRDEAAVIFEILGDMIEKDLLPKMNGDYIKDIPETSKDAVAISDAFINGSGMRFCELIYAMTIFLDGKEINDLLTQLINRFDNITSFLDVMEHEGIDSSFVARYGIFSNSRRISQELRVINSFARMTETFPTVKPEMVVEAALILGYPDKEEHLRAYVQEMMDKEKGPKNAYGRKDNNFRNFIINNVIESSRFKYLVRYGNPKKLRSLASNRKVVDYVLKGIPDEQIRAYYNSCNDMNKIYFPEMRDNLAEKITGLTFMEFSNVYQGNTKDTKLILDKERKKNIVRLYLTVLYLLLKNLVYVNSRYYMAFHCVERDRLLFDKNYGSNENKRDWVLYARDFLEKYEWEAKKKKRYLQMTQNFANADSWSLVAFRNCAEHLTVIRNADEYIHDIAYFDSYFELYHYLVQRHLIAQFEFDCSLDSKVNPGTKVMSEEQAEGKLLEYFAKVEKYHTYCKDFVKALCVPFAYNLARFKNLAINELFDRNNYLPSKAGGINPEE